MYSAFAGSAEADEGRYTLNTTAVGPAGIFSTIDLDLYDAPLTTIGLLDSNEREMRLRDLMYEFDYKKSALSGH